MERYSVTYFSDRVRKKRINFAGPACGAVGFTINMSRIGKEPIIIPEGVVVQIKGEDCHVKGARGEITQKVTGGIRVAHKDGVLEVSRPTEQKRHKALHGLYRSLLHNAVVGVTEGFRKELELVGVGYRASGGGERLELSLGYSHPIVFVPPAEVKVTTENVKGKNPKIVLESHDRQLLGAVVAKVRSLRKVDPYKGKGVRFVGEIVRKKAGKTVAK